MLVLLAYASVVRMTTLAYANRTSMTNTYCCEYNVEYSWWWTVDLSETCRVLYQINLRNSASHWLSLWEYIMMHAPLNVKLQGLHLQGYTVTLDCLTLNIKASRTYLPSDTASHSRRSESSMNVTLLIAQQHKYRKRIRVKPLKQDRLHHIAQIGQD